MRTAPSAGVQIVQFKDRVEVVEFFTGQKNTADAIDEVVRPETVVKRSQIKGGKVIPAATKVASAASGQAQSAHEGARKRDVKLEEKREKKVIDFLYEGERKIAGKTNCVQSQGRSFLEVLQLAYTMTSQEAKAKEV